MTSNKSMFVGICIQISGRDDKSIEFRIKVFLHTQLHFINQNTPHSPALLHEQCFWNSTYTIQTKIMPMCYFSTLICLLTFPR